MVTFDSFPDMSFTYSTVEEIKPGEVLMRDYIGFGHHTGGPHEFGGNPPVPPSGAFIADEPIHLTLKVNNGRIMEMVADTCGDGLAGPPGFYAKAKMAYEKKKSKIVVC